MGGSGSSPSSFVIFNRTDIRYSVSDISSPWVSACLGTAVENSSSGLRDELTMDFFWEDTVEDLPLLCLFFSSHYVNMVVSARRVSTNEHFVGFIDLPRKKKVEKRPLLFELFHFPKMSNKISRVD